MTRWLIPLALATVACAGGGVPGAAADTTQVPAAFADTLRGTVRMTGPEPGVTLVVVDAAGRAAVLEGDVALLRGLAGLEVTVHGTRTPHAFQVDAVDVRAVEGVPAVDGVLAHDGGRDFLVLRDGSRRPVARLPEALRGRVGAWVWLAGPLDGDIDSFGVIAARR